MNSNLNQLEKLINVKFNNIELLKQALIHRSYLNENRQLVLTSNERYEFLGDALLEMWISDYLFHLFPNLNEGHLTNLRALVVCTENLASIALQIELGEFIYFSKGEETHGGRHNQSILADTFESVIGAIYLDQGYDKTSQFLNQFLDPSVKTFSSQSIYKDPKSIFQEIAQDKRGVTPHYQTISESGPDHQKTFEVGVYLEEELIAKGIGASKQKAEEDASRKATKLLQS